MATTLNRISEQIVRIYKGSNITDKTELKKREVGHMVTQSIARRLKTSHLDTNMKLGFNIPNHTTVATYEDVAVSQDPLASCEEGQYKLQETNFTSGQVGIECTQSSASLGVMDSGSPGNVLSITKVVDDPYTYTISLPTSYTDTNGDAVADFIGGAAIYDVIEFEGIDAFNKFIRAGIYDVLSTDDLLTFKYNILNLNEVDCGTDIMSYVVDVHTNLEALSAGASVYGSAYFTDIYRNSFTGQDESTLTVSLSGSTYSFSFIGLNYSGTTYSDVFSHISNCDDNNVVKFQGLAADIPKAFIRKNISALNATASTLSFDYIIDTSDDLDCGSSVDADVLDTNTILEGMAVSEEFEGIIFTNIICSEYSINTYGSYCWFSLPAHPIALPLSMGVWRVYQAGDINNPFIPVQPGEMALVANIDHNNLSTIIGDKIAYELHDNTKVKVNRPIGIVGETVNVQLLINDIDTYNSYDSLPIPNDMEATVIEDVLKLLGVSPPPPPENEKV